MMAPMMMYYGVTGNFKRMTVGKDHICMLEQYERGGESGDETVCRLHMLDKKTGAKIKRNYIGHMGELIALKDELVCYTYNDEINLYDIKNGETKYAIGKDDWPAQFNELSAGIEQINYYQNYSDPRKPMIEMTCKDGNNYWFEPFSKKLMKAEPTDRIAEGFYSSGYELKYQNAEGKNNYLLSFGYVEGSKRKKIIGSVVENLDVKLKNESSLTYLEPEYLGIDDKNKLFIFVHFSNTDKTDFTVECLNYDLKTLWKKTKTELEVEDSYSEEFTFDIYSIENNILYFNIGGFMLAMQTKTGDIIWKTRN